MKNPAQKISHGDYYLDLTLEEEEEEEVENIPIELVQVVSTKAQRKLCKEVGSATAYISTPPREPKTSGFRRRVVTREQSFTPSNNIRIPKTFSVVIKYHYPLMYFPAALNNELEEVQKFFKITNRGSGSTHYCGRMVSTLGYRVSFDSEKTRIFTRTIVEILDRYGVEILTHEIIRIK